MSTAATFLAPGQRYTKTDGPAWRADLQLVIVGIARDGARGLLVTYRCPSGRQVSGPAANFELALAAGEIVPVVGTGRVAEC
jgi:hypothetical protein